MWILALYRMKTRCYIERQGNTTAMTRIAIAEKQNGTPVDWMEKVTDEQYQAGVTAS